MNPEQAGAKALGILLRPLVRKLLAPVVSGGGSLFDLHDNVILTWALRRAKRDPWTIAAAVVYLGAIYGILGVVYTFFAGARGGARWDEFLFIVHVVTWGANAFVFLLYVPTRFAQLIAFERERRTLDFLRMTALPGWNMALGSFAAAYVVPVALFVCSIPQILASCFSEESSYVVGVVSSYSGLFASSLVATTISGIVAFIPKKAQSAGGAALLVVIAINALGGCYRIPYVELLGCLGPWGGMIGTISNAREPFLLTILGADLPGLLLQVPFAILLGLALLHAIAAKIDDERAGVLGPRAAAFVATLVGALVVLGFGARPPENPLAWGWRSWTSNFSAVPGMAAGGRLLALLAVTLPFAADSAILRDDLVRAFARGKDELDRAHAFRPVLVIIGIFAAAGAALAACAGLGDAGTAVFLAAMTAASYVVVAAFAFQTARVVFPEKVPNLIAFCGLGALWMLPLIGAKVFEELRAPSFLCELPTAFCPFVTVLRVASVHDPNASVGEVNPIALGLVAIAANGLIATGLLAALRGATAQAAEFARTLVVLPADAFSAAGSLDRRCSNGHVYASTWSTCPHCPADAPKDTGK